MDLVQLVSNTVVQFVNAQKTFTAFDVTTEIRSNHPNETIFHYEVRPLVHSVMQVYNVNYKNKQDFSKHQNGPITYFPKNPVTKQIIAVPQLPGTPSTTARVLDKRGRLFLTKSDTTWLNNASRLDVLASPIEGNLSIINDRDTRHMNHKLVVDQYGGVKISSKLLKAGNVDITKPIYVHKTDLFGYPELVLTNEEKV